MVDSMVVAAVVVGAVVLLVITVYLFIVWDQQNTKRIMLAAQQQVHLNNLKALGISSEYLDTNNQPDSLARGSQPGGPINAWTTPDSAGATWQGSGYPDPNARGYTDPSYDFASSTGGYAASNDQPPMNPRLLALQEKYHLRLQKQRQSVRPPVSAAVAFGVAEDPPPVQQTNSAAQLERWAEPHPEAGDNAELVEDLADMVVVSSEHKNALKSMEATLDENQRDRKVISNPLFKDDDNDESETAVAAVDADNDVDLPVMIPAPVPSSSEAPPPEDSGPKNTAMMVGVDGDNQRSRQPSIKRAVRPDLTPYAGTDVVGMIPTHTRWEDADPNYRPTAYTAPEVLAQTVAGLADPGLMTVIKPGAVQWNALDDSSQPPVDRRSLTGQAYVVHLGVPQSPLGRTGFSGRGALPWWGPNRRVVGVVTKPGSSGQRLVLVEFVNGEWQFPECKVAPGETEDAALMTAVAGGVCAHRGGVDCDDVPALIEPVTSVLSGTTHTLHKGAHVHSLNTDNAWVESVVVACDVGAPDVDEALATVLEDNAAQLRWTALSEGMAVVADQKALVEPVVAALAAYDANAAEREQQRHRLSVKVKTKTHEVFDPAAASAQDETKDEDVAATVTELLLASAASDPVDAAVGMDVIDEEKPAEAVETTPQAEALQNAASTAVAAVVAPIKRTDPAGASLPVVEQRLPKDGEVNVSLCMYRGCVDTTEAGGRDVVSDSVKMLEAVGTTEPVLVRLVIGAEGVEIQEPPPDCGTIDDKKMHPSVMTVATSTIVDVPVHAISYTSSDKHNKRIFAFVANSKEKDIMQCYVFETKRAKVQCDAIRHSFVVAQEIKLDPFAVNRKMEATPKALGLASIFKRRQLIIKRQHLQSKRIIGHGQYGKVYLAEYTQGKGSKTPVHAAVKLMRANLGHVDGKDFLSEAVMMSNFDHEHLLNLLGVCIEKRPWLMVAQYMHYKDVGVVLKHCRRHKAWLRTNEMLTMVIQVASGMEYMASKRFIHRDLAARNILMSHQNALKIGDFGLARELPVDKDYWRLDKPGRLPVKYMALESLTLKRFSEKSDVWAFAVFMWEVMSYNAVPWAAEKIPNTGVKDAVKAGTRLGTKGCDMRLVDDGAEQNTANQALWEWWHSLLQKCWLKDLTMRPTFAELHQLLKTQHETAAAAQPDARDVGKMCFVVLEEARRRGRGQGGSAIRSAPSIKRPTTAPAPAFHD
eukprot:m.1196997 g.1196997  ORF g.1196997 m.1196997 type:complete len:1210 (-) comp24565_c0_seq1:1893-5522(-)